MDSTRVALPGPPPVDGQGEPEPLERDEDRRARDVDEGVGERLAEDRIADDALVVLQADPPRRLHHVVGGEAEPHRPQHGAVLEHQEEEDGGHDEGHAPEPDPPAVAQAFLNSAVARSTSAAASSRAALMSALLRMTFCTAQCIASASSVQIGVRGKKTPLSLALMISPTGGNRFTRGFSVP